VSRVTAVVGEPGTGKTTLVRQYMALSGAQYGVWKGPYQGVGERLVRFHTDGDRRFVVGVYDPSWKEDDSRAKFAGTDRLSMAVQPSFLRWMTLPCNRPEDASFLFEGDRLGSVACLQELAALGHDVRVVHLTCAGSELERRREHRGDAMSSAFLKGRRTKVQRVVDHFAPLGRCVTFASDIRSDWDRALDRLKERME
jgi:hypothetical protein